MTNKFIFKSTNIELFYFSLAEAERLVPKPSWALISVSDPGIEPCIKYEQWSHSLRLTFQDISDQAEGTLFTPAMARRLIEFAVSLPPTIDCIIVHCISGVSRSPAIVRFLTRYVFKDCLNADFDADYWAYNSHVYKVLVRAWGKYKNEGGKVVKWATWKIS